MRRYLLAAGLGLAFGLIHLPTKASAEDRSLELAGASAAFQEMIAFGLSGELGEAPKDFCVGLKVSPEPADHPGLADLPENAFKSLQEMMAGRADLHPASQCVIFGQAAAFKGRRAMLLFYWSVDTEIDAALRPSGIEVPVQPLRSSFEPNRLGPSQYPPFLAVELRPDGRMRWDGYGQVGETCGPRYYDFAGDAQAVRILDSFQAPEIC